MAVDSLIITCDWCENETRQFKDEMEAAEDGWWLLIGPAKPERQDTDAIRELAFCKAGCVHSYFDYYGL